MENASKALIIAGAILLSILIIALGIYVFNMAKSATNTDQLSQLEVSQFNDIYTTYNGPQLGSMVASLLDKVITNASDNKEADERLIDIVYVDTSARSAKVTAMALCTGSPTADDTQAQNDALALAGVANGSGNVISRISSNSTDQNINALGRLRSNMAQKHYYKVTCHVSETTGLVDCIVINYTNN